MLNKSKKEILKLFKSFILLLILAIVIFGVKYCVSAGTIQEYESQVAENNKLINHYEETKKQLHTTAQLLRQEKNPDNELIDSLSAKWRDCNENIQRLSTDNVNLALKIEELNKQTLIGYFTITHYDICYNCTSKNPGDRGYGITATGTIATPGRTIAVDPKVIPYGSKVIINGHTYIAEDTGRAIKENKIDICVATHNEAIQKGIKRNVPVYVIQK